MINDLLKGEDTRTWLYEYRVHFDVGYQLGTGFGSKFVSNRFHELIADAQRIFQSAYKQPSPGVVMIGFDAAIYFSGWDASVRFTEWGPNRTSRNWPSVLELIDKIIKHVVTGMNGAIKSKELREMPLEFTDVSDRLKLPMQKERQTTKEISNERADQH